MLESLKFENLTLPQLEKLELVLEYSKQEAKKVNTGNGYYDWNINSQVVQNGAAMLYGCLCDAVFGRISKADYTTALYTFFDIIYEETYRQWRQELERIRKEHEYFPREDFLRIDAVKISSRELEYLSVKWQAWEYQEGFKVVYDEFDNQIGEPDYSYIELPDRTIRKLTDKMRFGKYGPNGKLGRYRAYTIEEIMEIDAQYLVWLHNNSDGFRMSEELLVEAGRWTEVTDRRRERKTNDRENATRQG